jgi:hypothetical protein
MAMSLLRSSIFGLSPSSLLTSEDKTRAIRQKRSGEKAGRAAQAAAETLAFSLDRITRDPI